MKAELSTKMEAETSTKRSAPSQLFGDNSNKRMVVFPSHQNNNKVAFKEWLEIIRAALRPTANVQQVGVASWKQYWVISTTTTNTTAQQDSLHDVIDPVQYNFELLHRLGRSLKVQVRLNDMWVWQPRHHSFVMIQARSSTNVLSSSMQHWKECAVLLDTVNGTPCKDLATLRRIMASNNSNDSWYVLTIRCLPQHATHLLWNARIPQGNSQLEPDCRFQSIVAPSPKSSHPIPPPHNSCGSNNNNKDSHRKQAHDKDRDCSIADSNKRVRLEASAMPKKSVKKQMPSHPKSMTIDDKISQAPSRQATVSPLVDGDKPLVEPLQNTNENRAGRSNVSIDATVRPQSSATHSTLTSTNKLPTNNNRRLNTTVPPTTSLQRPNHAISNRRLPILSHPHWLLPSDKAHCLCPHWKHHHICRRRKDNLCELIHVHGPFNALFPKLFRHAFKQVWPCTEADYLRCVSTKQAVVDGATWWTAGFVRLNATSSQSWQQDIVYVEGGGRLSEQGIWWFESEKQAKKQLFWTFGVAVHAAQYGIAPPRH